MFLIWCIQLIIRFFAFYSLSPLCYEKIIHVFTDQQNFLHIINAVWMHKIDNRDLNGVIYRIFNYFKVHITNWKVI